MPDSLTRFRTSTAKRWRWLISVAALLTLTDCGTTSSGHAPPTVPVQIHITLEQTRVTGGVAIKGRAGLTNNTSKSITVEQCAKDGWLMVGLTNKQIPFDPATSSVACPPSVRLIPGPNRFPVTVMTTYQECLQPGGQSTTFVPPCLHSNGLPPLPAGIYKTKVVTSGLPGSTTMPRPIEVTVTARR
jgi:hypothetical protein